MPYIVKAFDFGREGLAINIPKYAIQLEGIKAGDLLEVTFTKRTTKQETQSPKKPEKTNERSETTQQENSEQITSKTEAQSSTDLSTPQQTKKPKIFKIK